MDQYNDIDGLGMWPEFEKGMDLCVYTDGILVELENCSNGRSKSAKSVLGYEDRAVMRVTELTVTVCSYTNGAGIQ